MRINKANPWCRDGSPLSVVAIAAVGIVLSFGAGREVAAQTPNPLESSLHEVGKPERSSPSGRPACRRAPPYGSALGPPKWASRRSARP